MPHTPRVKSLAYTIDPECWISYSGTSVSHKRDTDARRSAALAAAQWIVDKSPIKENIMPTATVPIAPVREALLAVVNAISKDRALAILEKFEAQTVRELHPHQYADVINACWAALAVAKHVERKHPMTPLKIKLMLHFASVLGPYPVEHVRTSQSYTTFVRELLRDGMIERPTREQRDLYPGWAYKATARGLCYVKALTEVPLPVRTDPVWAMPV
jgi:hypothetical protein